MMSRPFFVQCQRVDGRWTVEPASAAQEDQLGASVEPVRDGHLTLFADARIDDRERLCTALNIAGDAGDAQAILRAYQEWGEACLDHLIGDFAFVLIDHAQDKLLCARDHLGVRPCYFGRAGNRFVAASDLPLLASACPELTATDIGGLANIVSGHAAVNEPATAYAGISILPAAHRLVISGESEAMARYWRPTARQDNCHLDDAAIIARGRALLDQAVKDRMRGGTNFAAHVSGGLDSSAIAVLLAQESQRRGLAKPLAYAWHGNLEGDPDGQEAFLVQEMQRVLDLPFAAPKPDEQAIRKLLEKDLSAHGLQTEMIHECVVQDHARHQGIDTIFSGWGGDQALSFNGKGYRQTLLFSGRWRQLARIGGGGRRGFLAGLKRAIKECQPIRLNRSRRTVSERTFLAAPYHQTLAKAPEGARIRFGVKSRICDLIANPALSQRLIIWCHAGRAAGLTYVYPLLDKRLI